jgi:hypothetical protein
MFDFHGLDFFFVTLISGGGGYVEEPREGHVEVNVKKYNANVTP